MATVGYSGPNQPRRAVVFGLRTPGVNGKDVWTFGFRVDSQGLPNGAVVFAMFTHHDDAICFVPAGLDRDTEEEFWAMVRDAQAMLWWDDKPDSNKEQS